MANRAQAPKLRFGEGAPLRGAPHKTLRVLPEPAFPLAVTAKPKPWISCAYPRRKALNISLGFRNQNTVTSVFSCINHTSFITCGVKEHIELMVKEIHLQDSLIKALWFKDNLF